MYKSVVKNIFIIGFSILGLGFLSAQFVIPSGINNALQIVQRVLVTTTGTSTGTVVMDTNTGISNIYINPGLLPIVVPYSGSYVLTLNASGYVSLTNMTDFVQNNNFTTNGSWSFGGQTNFNNQVTFSTGPVVFNAVTTTFSGGTIHNTNATINNNSGTVINSNGTTFNNTNTTVSNTNVTTNNNGGTTNNSNNTVNNSGSTINNTGVTNNNYSGTVTNYYTGSTIVYHSGTTVVFATGVVVTGAAIVGPQGNNGLSTLFLSTPEPAGINCANSGYILAYGLDDDNNTILAPNEVDGNFYVCHGIDGTGGSALQNLYLTNNLLSISSGNDVDLSGSFWSLMGNAIDDTVHFLGTLTQETLRIVTNNIERMTILRENGYVGINNPNPEKMLHVNGAIASSLMKVSTGGTNIDLYSFNGHYENLNNTWPTFLSYDWSTHYTPDGKAFFFPLPQGTNYFGDGDFLSGLVQYIVFIDVQDVNTVILEPGIGEAFYVGGFINGTAGQKLSVIQRDFVFDGSGNAQNVSLMFPSPFFEEGGSGEIIQDISMYGPNTLDYLFSSITQSQRGSAISDSYKHFPSHPGIFNGGFDSTYNGSGASGDSFAFQVLDILGFCNLPREYDENIDDGPGSVCVRGTTYVYDGQYWLRTYGGL